VTRRIDEIQVVGLSVARSVLQRCGLRLDGDAPLTLQVHRIEHLLGHFALRQPAAALDETVCQRRLAMINMAMIEKLRMCCIGLQKRVPFSTLVSRFQDFEF